MNAEVFVAVPLRKNNSGTQTVGVNVIKIVGQAGGQPNEVKYECQAGRSSFHL